MVFRRRPRPQWFVYFPTRTGWIQRSTGTSDKATAQAVERVFRGLDRWAVGEAHRQRLRALRLEGYRLHDARHRWAVRMAARWRAL